MHPLIALDPHFARATQVPLPSSPAPEFTEAPFANSDGPKSDETPSITFMYLKYAQEDDDAALSHWNADLDVQLIFAALFSAIVTAFFISSLSDLQEDFGKTSAKLLQILVAQSLGHATESTHLAPFQTDPMFIIVNSLWCASLIISLGTALLDIHCKQWLRSYAANLSPIPSIRALQRHQRHKAFENWHVSGIIAILPVTLHAAVMLFFAGLVMFLRAINSTVAITATSLVGVMSTVYLAFFIVPFISDAPFHTPIMSLVKSASATALSFFPILFTTISSLAVSYPLIIRENLVEENSPWRQLKRNHFSIEHLSKNIHMEEKNTEFLVWLLRYRLTELDLNKVIKMLFAVKGKGSRQILAASNADVVVAHHMESFCFVNDGKGEIRVNPEKISQALSCVALWRRIVTSRKYVDVPSNPFVSLTAESAVAALLDQVEGHDTLRLLGTSMWWISKGMPGARHHIVRRHLLDHINSITELPDDVVRILVDAPNPGIGMRPVLIKLLQKYLDRTKLPSADCISAILLSLCNSASSYRPDLWSAPPPQPWSDEMTANLLKFWGLHYRPSRWSTIPSLIAFLLENLEECRRPLLCLVRALWQTNADMVRDRDLSKSLLLLLTRSPPSREALVVEILDTISAAPDSCQLNNQALTNLVRFYQHHKCGTLAPKSILAIASFTESIFYSSHYISTGWALEQQLTAAVNTISDSILDTHEISTDLNILLPSMYTISIIANKLKDSLSSTRIPSLLPRLVEIVSASMPTSERQTMLSRHAVRVICKVVTQDISKASTLNQSVAIWEHLAVCDDEWLRWLSFDILKHVSYHLPRAERKRIFGTIRNDLENRLQTSSPTAFIHHKWKDITDATLLAPVGSEPPRVILAREISKDISESGIRELLEGAPENFFCSTSTYDDLTSLYPIEAWMRLNVN